jgi:hypothetical protein
LVRRIGLRIERGDADSDANGNSLGFTSDRGFDADTDDFLLGSFFSNIPLFEEFGF